MLTHDLKPSKQCILTARDTAGSSRSILDCELPARNLFQLSGHLLNLND